MQPSKTPQDLIRTLWPEAFQTEESARVHPEREAKRLRSVPPGVAMKAVAAHASGTLAKLKKLAEARGARQSVAATALGQFLSVARTFSSDLLVSREKSYRGTILGIHHGIGLFALLEDAALAANDEELADFCAELLAERRKLVLAAEEQLAWFAEHPESAQRRASVPDARAAAAT